MKSEIRDSSIRNLLDRAAKRKYSQYLLKLNLKHLRAFRNQPVAFDFPVTAIIGPNGGGKTSVLGAAAILYQSVQPRRFFAKGGKFDASMQDWVVEYEVIDRKQNQSDAFRRTASFKKSKWNRDALKRSVQIFGISRTVPASERKEYLKLANTKFSVPESQIEALPQEAITAINRILGRDASGYKRLKFKAEGSSFFLTGKTQKGEGYSEFHFGAGESSVIRMVSLIELAEPESLILIKEIENGLHPVATVRMTEYLIEAAERKKIQVIFTTHSDDALRVLPPQAIWVATNDHLYQGKLEIESLRAITGEVDPNSKVVLFVEDEFARTWVEAIIRQSGKIALDQVEIHGMKGDGIAVAVHRNRSKDPSIKVPSVCLIDGDSQQSDSEAHSILRLPGAAPESEVFDRVMEGWGSIGGKMAVSLFQRFENSDKVKEVCESTRLTCMDTHSLFQQIGERLSLIPKETVVQAFTNTYAQLQEEQLASLIAGISQALTKEEPA